MSRNNTFDTKNLQTKDDSTTQGVLFTGLFDKPLSASFDQPDSSSDSCAMLLKLAVWIEPSTRRLVLHLPDLAPWRADWCRIARALGAVPT